jgi:hypothetical protein
MFAARHSVRDETLGELVSGVISDAGGLVGAHLGALRHGRTIAFDELRSTLRSVKRASTPDKRDPDDARHTLTDAMQARPLLSLALGLAAGYLIGRLFRKSS